MGDVWDLKVGKRSCHFRNRPFICSTPPHRWRKLALKRYKPFSLNPITSTGFLVSGSVLAFLKCFYLCVCTFPCQRVDHGIIPCLHKSCSHAHALPCTSSASPCPTHLLLSNYRKLTIKHAPFYFSPLFHHDRLATLCGLICSISTPSIVPARTRIQPDCSTPRFSGQTLEIFC